MTQIVFIRRFAAKLAFSLRRWLNADPARSGRSWGEAEQRISFTQKLFLS
jgi:hypothetical protein